MQPTIICDIDDVLNNFKNVFIPLKHNNLDLFINEHGFRNLSPKINIINLLKIAHECSINIIIITARNGSNNKVVEDTIWWINKYNIPFDQIIFTEEKANYISNSKLIDEYNILFCIEDHPRHIIDYLKLGLKVFSPYMWHNQFLEYTDYKVNFYNQNDINQLLNSLLLI